MKARERPVKRSLHRIMDFTSYFMKRDPSISRGISIFEPPDQQIISINGKLNKIEENK